VGECRGEVGWGWGGWGAEGGGGGEMVCSAFLRFSVACRSMGSLLGSQCRTPNFALGATDLKTGEGEGFLQKGKKN